MQPPVNNEDMVTYYIQVRCLTCEIALTLNTREKALTQGLKKNDLMFGPCPDCNAPFLRVVGIE